MNIYAGEYFQFDLPVKDVTGATVTDLSTAGVIRFGIKSYLGNDTDYLMIIDDVDHPTQVAVDTPATGTIRITIFATDLASDLGEEDFRECYLELQIRYDATDIRVVRIYEDGEIIKTFQLFHTLVDSMAVPT